ncbi:3-hydroxyacyl-CoA dehydrogenase [Streptomyces sp. NPDC097619]|uniref:3-hydroxyacyl-CoA dehydrogenase n=1 Tax=Streptomyces sp. NPDC097619 TaxID=3157228 RepID=UPI0033266674
MQHPADPAPSGRPVGVAGTGAMGTGIAETALLAGEHVVLYGRRPEAGREVERTLGERLRRRERAGRLGDRTAEEHLARLRTTTELGELAGAALVIETIAEDPAAKTALLRAVEAVVAPDCVIATNTSALSLPALARVLERPGRFAGMHFFNPVPAMRLVEVVAGPATDEDTAELLAATALRWGKIPVRCAPHPGFVVNRVARPFYGEALRVLEERAAEPAEIDAVLTGSGGFRLGPCALMDLIGHDVNEAVTRELWRAFHHDARYVPSLVQRRLVEAGHLGRKTGRGFYRHEAGTPTSVPAPEDRYAPGGPGPEHPYRDRPLYLTGGLGPAAALPGLLAAAGSTVRPGPVDGPEGLTLPDGTLLRTTDGRTAAAHAAETGRPVALLDLALDYAGADRLAVTFDEGAPKESREAVTALLRGLGKEVTVVGDTPGLLVFRTVAMLVNEAAEAVHQGVADAADVDTAMRLGTNYPEGPLAWGDRLGADTVLRFLDNLAHHYRDGRYRPSLLLQRRALSGLRLAA